MVVETLKKRRVLGEVIRSAFNEQPIFMFSKLNGIELIPDKIIWPYRRLRISSDFVIKWFDNGYQKIQLSTVKRKPTQENVRFLCRK